MTETRADRETGRGGGGGGWVGLRVRRVRRTVGDRGAGAGQKEERKEEQKSLKGQNRFGKTQHYPLLPPGGGIN